MTEDKMEKYILLKNAWERYLAKEVDFLHIQSYLPFTKENLNIYSPKLLDLIIVLGSELESVFKVIGKIFKGIIPGKMDEYKDITLNYISDLPNKKFEMYKDIGVLVENPFKDWSVKKLDLWDYYIKIKHHLSDDIKKYGTWEYALKFQTALFLLLNATCEKFILDEDQNNRNKYILSPFSQIFKFRYYNKVNLSNVTIEQDGNTLRIN